MKESTQEQMNLITFCLQVFGEFSNAKDAFTKENIKSYDFCQQWLDMNLPLAEQLYNEAKAERFCW